MNQESGSHKTPNPQGKNESSLEETKSPDDDSFSLAELWCFPLAGLVAG